MKLTLVLSLLLTACSASVSLTGSVSSAIAAPDLKSWLKTGGVLKPGTYAVTEQLLVSGVSNVTADGKGEVTIDCAKWKPNGALACLKFDHVTKYTLRNVKILNCPRDCVMVTDSNGFTIQGATLTGYDSDLILTSDSSDVWIDHNVGSWTGSPGPCNGHCRGHFAYCSQRSDRCRMTGNTATGPRASAFQINAESGHPPESKSIEIFGNTLRGGGHAAVNCIGCVDGKIAGNDFESAKGIALWDESPEFHLVNKHLTVSGNRIRARSDYGVQVNGVEDSVIGPNDFGGGPGVVTVKNAANARNEILP